MARIEPFGELDKRVGEGLDLVFSSMNVRLRPDQLSPGVVAWSQNGRMDVDGAWQPRKGIESFAAVVSTITENLQFPFHAYAPARILDAERIGGTVTIDTEPHAFIDGTVVSVSGLTGSVNVNGNRVVNVVDERLVTIDLQTSGGREDYLTAPDASIGSAILSEGFSAVGSCLFSDPATSNTEWIIVALTNNALAFRLRDGTSVQIDYPAGVTYTNPVEMIQALDQVFLFQDGVTTLQFSGSLDDADPAFVKVRHGAYGQSPRVHRSNGNLRMSNGNAIVNVPAGHGYRVGDALKIYDGGASGIPNDTFVTVSNSLATIIQFFWDVPDTAANVTISIGKAQSRGLGFTRMPAPPWGVYIERRLVVPYLNAMTGVEGAEVITSRGRTDEIILSDVFDVDTFDQLQHQFRPSGGQADFVQTVHPFTEDSCLIFCRNSIHRMSGISGSLSDVAITQVTDEAGLVARKSVVTLGNRIFFLSDNGVYSLTFSEDYSLRGGTLPISDPINPLMERINDDSAAEAIAIYHNNRYWLAVPLDDSGVNNTILVYNLLNDGWESVDQIDNPNWNISNFLRAGAGAVDSLYVVNRNGGIHIVDSRDDDTDSLTLFEGIAAQRYPVNSFLRTRQLTLDSFSRKRYSTLELHIESSLSNSSDARISGETENRDSTFLINTVSSVLGHTLGAGEDASLRMRTGGQRAYGMQVTVTPTQGRPKIRAVHLEATEAHQSQTQAT